MIIQAKKLSKLLPMVLLLVFLLVNPVLYAAGKNDSTQVTGSQILNQVVSESLNKAQSEGPDWLKNTDIQFTFTENYQPEYSLETIQSFAKTDAKGNLVFLQGRYANQNDNYSANLGLGWRKLAEDKSRLFGLNAFYDYGFQYSLSRVGLGLEYFSKLIEHRLNCYIPLSGDKVTGQSDTENGLLYSYVRAVAGCDYELGTSLANAPWLKLYASGFYYDNKYNPTETGYKLRTTMRFTPCFFTELGYVKSNMDNGGFYGRVMFQLANSPEPSLFFNGNREKDSQKVDLSSKLLQKVERNNNIKTEIFSKYVSGGAVITVTDGDAPLSEATVSVTVNGAVQTATTNSSGVATFRNLSAGTYTFTASMTGYNSNSADVTVTNGAIATGVISLGIQTFNITANAGTGGTISPSGTTAVSYNGSQTYTITLDSGYAIDSVTVDGTDLSSPSSSYTFSNVTQSHSISVTFKQNPSTVTIQTNRPGGTYFNLYTSSGGYVAGHIASDSEGNVSLELALGSYQILLYDDQWTKAYFTVNQTPTQSFNLTLSN